MKPLDHHSFLGRERRRHRLYVTQNTEYHLRDRICVGVRDLWSGRWRPDHPAVGKWLFGAVRSGEAGLEPLAAPEVDCLLWFENGDNDILTSRLTVITRPHRRCLDRYLPEGQSELPALRAERATTGASDDARLAAGQSESRTLRAAA
jgi:hypothetical protein